MSKNKPLVFLDVSIDGDPFERMIFELFTDVAPKTAENFRLLCTGEKGESSKTGRPLHYKGTFFHRIIKGSMAKAGDLLRREGNYGESIYGEKFPDESPKLKHDGPGLLSMAIADRDERGSLFIVTFKADYHLDRKCVVFGKLVLGNEVLKKIENVGDEDGRPSVTVKIINCGELDRRKLHKLKLGKDASPQANSHEVRRKGKHKKSSKERRKKRRHYTSESSSSSDDETESSESDSDSDSYESSSTEVSSSSDDRRRKRKRSKRDKHRRGKKDSRREKRRKQHDKKSKRKSKRASDNLSGRDSESEGGPKGNAGEAQGLEMKPKNLERNHSPSVEEGEAASVWEKRGEPTDMFEREDGEFPKDNGEPQSNGIGVENRSQRSADKQPDIVDDHPDKSRSRSISPKRSLSKSMSISPKRSPSRSRSVSPKQSMSRSRSVSGSPQRQLLRSRSTSPVRSASSRSPSRNVSRSPTRGKKGRSVSASPPVRGRTQKSSSRSPSASPARRPTRSPPRASARRSSRKSASRSPARSSRRGVSRSPVQPRRSLSRSPVRLSRRSVSRSSGRAPSRRSPSRSSGRAPSRNNRRSYSRSPRNGSRMVRSPISDRGRSSSRSPSVEASPQRVRRGRGFSERYSYVRRYRSRSPDRSPVRSYRYGGGRVDRDRYPSYRRSPRRYRSPPRGRTPTRYRGRRSRSRSRSLSHSPIRYRRRYSRSPVRSRSPVDRHRGSPRAERRRSPSRSGSPSESRSSLDSQSPKQVSKEKSRSSSGSPPGRTGLVSYGDGSPDSGRD